MAGGDGEDEITGINVTPLVDIVLVLLIIFMVTANMIVRETVEIDVPSAAPADAGIVKPPVMLTLDKDAKVFFDGIAVDDDGLITRLKEAVLNDKDTRAVINADPALDYGKVVGLIDLVKGAGISKFALNLQKEAKPAAASP